MQKRILPALLCVFLLASAGSAVANDKKQNQPNIVWITCEDMGPHLGCYGDTYATSPNIDKLAKRSLRYLYCWSNAPVCAPARTAIISGVYPPSTGSQHMRSFTQLPPGMDMYPVLLRMAGYYCTNNVKEDYNLKKPQQLWHMSSRKAHWKHRREGQPFFAIFNFTVTHESRIRQRPKKVAHDPAKAPLPAYHPDHPNVRRDWAQYYDNITTMDKMVGEVLKQIEDAGLAEDTIIFFYADHGSGMPRSKRFPYNSGLHVPLLVHVPDKYRDLAPKDYAAGKTTDRLVSFVDLAPTVLSLAGVKPPTYYQGHAFMGKYEIEPQPYIYGFRGRMDERYDMVRSVRDKRYVYVRNYMPHRACGQHVDYMFKTATTSTWKKLFDEGKLNAAQSRFWMPRASEELFDLKNDPDEVNNLATSEKHQEILNRMRKAQQELVFKIRDVGFLPEDEIHSRSQGSTPYQVGHNRKNYPLERIFKTAEAASRLKSEAVPQLVKDLEHSDSAVRYWAAMGLLMRGKNTVKKHLSQLRLALADKASGVQIVAAEALGKYGEPKDIKSALEVLMKLAPPHKNDVHTSMMALNALDYLGDKAVPALKPIASFPPKFNSNDGRANYGVAALIRRLKPRIQQ